MAYRRNRSALMTAFLLAFGLAALSGCSEMGKKYVAFKVTSDPPGASVDSLMDNKISGGKFVNASLGTTPTEREGAHFAFGAPGVGDTKLGVRVHKSGYKVQELFFDPSDWYNTTEEARRHVKEISMVLEREPDAGSMPAESKPAESKPVAKEEVPREPQPARESDVQPKAGGEENATTVDAGQFQFKVPATWTRAPKSEEDELKRTMLAGARQMLDTEKGSMEIEQFYMFKTPEDAMVLVYNVLVPATMPVHDYMTKLRAMNETKFEYGRQSGIVKRVIKIKLTEGKDLSVLETEYVAAQGENNRTLIYNLAGGPSPKFTVAISAFFPENNDQFQESVKKVMESVAGLVTMSSDMPARAQDANFDSVTFKQEMAKIKKLGKDPLPVYSEQMGGSITLAKWKLDGKGGATMYFAPMGWIAGSSLDLGSRAPTYVLVNVGPKPVRVGEDVLEMGEYAMVRDGNLVKVDAEELTREHGEAARPRNRPSAPIEPEERPMAAKIGHLEQPIMDHVTARVGERLIRIQGKLVMQAQDGGIFLLARDGVLWAIQPEELVARTSGESRFNPVTREEMSTTVLANLPSDFHVHSTSHYLVFYKKSETYAQWSGMLFERLYTTFREYWAGKGIELLEPDFPLVALVLDDKQSYQEFTRDELGEASQQIITGHYSLMTNRMTMYAIGFDAAGESSPTTIVEPSRLFAMPDAERNVANIIHIATLQIMYNCGMLARYSDCPHWFSQGMASYFETPDLRSSEGWSTVGEINRFRLAEFQKSLDDRPRDSLTTLIANDERSKGLAGLAEGWALTYFLLHNRSTHYVSYLRVLSEKQPLLYDDPKTRLEEFKNCFGDFDMLDAEFLSFIARKASAEDE